MNNFLQQAAQLTPGINIGIPVFSSAPTKLSSVKNTSEAERYPMGLNAQDVLLDANDPDIAYFRQSDQNGFVQVERCRCVPEPELVPTQQIDTSQYVTQDAFNNFANSMEEAIKNVQQSINDVLAANSGKYRSNRRPNQSRNAGSQGNVQGSFSQQESVGNVAAFNAAQSNVNPNGQTVGG